MLAPLFAGATRPAAGTTALTDIFKEVEEDLRRDRFRRLWDRHGRTAIAVAVAIVIGTAAGVGFNAWRDGQRARSTEALSLASQQFMAGQAGAAAAFERLAEEAPSGIALLARFNRARAAASAGDRAAAAAVFREIGADRSVDDLYRELANLLWVYAAFDTATADDLDAALAPLAADGAHWRHSARELQALVAVRRGDRTRAREILSKVAADPEAPLPMRGRIAELIDIVGR